MKKYLLFIISMLCTSIGAWAQTSFGSNGSKWEIKPGKTLVITLNEGDKLQDLITTWTDTYNNVTLPSDISSSTVSVIKLEGNASYSKDDYTCLEKFTGISSFDFSDATLASGFWGGISSNSTTVVLPKSVTDARSYYTNTIVQEAVSNNPHQIKHIFAYKDATEITCYLTGEGATDVSRLFCGTDDKTTISDANYTNYINGVKTLNIEHITKGQRVTLNTELVSSINTAWQSIETINCVNATAPDNSNFTIANVHAKTINLSGLNAKNGFIKLADAGDAQSLVTEFVLTGAKVQKISVYNQDQLEVLNITDIVLEDGGVVDVTGAGNGQLVIHVSDDTVNITPKSGESGTSYTISDPLRNAYTFSDFTQDVNKSTYNMALHEPDATDKLCYWYVSDQTATDAVVTIDLNSRIGELSNILTEIGNKPFEKVIINGPVSADDVTAFKDIDATVLDLSGATLKRKDGNTYVADNSIIKSATNDYVKFLVLPDGSTRDDVKDASNNVTSAGIVNAEALKGFTALYSAVEEHVTDSKRSITTYTKKEGTLQPAMVATGLASVGWTRNSRNAFYPNCNQNSNLTYATLSGNLNAYDICNSNRKVDGDGHFKWDKEADETNAGEDKRQLLGDNVEGGLAASGPILELDLEQAVFANNYDMTLSGSGANILSSTTWKVIIPTSKAVTETPPYFITSNGVKEICIPSNIEVIHTHFAPSVDHVWTNKADGDFDNMEYDNGVFDGTKDTEGNLKKVTPLNGETGYTKADLNSVGTNGYPCGTYTFSSKLKMIESNAFANTTPHVKDVYVLATDAPECHVDAFNTGMYVGNSGFSPNIVDGVITRDSYLNGHNWIVMLHYPRNCKTPAVQRYTDPTRKYTTASNETDGKGGVLYYPNFSEFLAAYAQGTTGYLWNAWSQEYEFGQLKQTLNIGNAAWSESIQKQANLQYEKNPKRAQNTFTSFYDVTANGAFSQPEGLVPYYNVYWDERTLRTSGTDAQHLYPQAETDATSTHIKYMEATKDDFLNGSKIYTLYNGTYTETNQWNDGSTYYKVIQRQATDENGKPQFEKCTNGLYVKDTRYVKADDGDLVKTTTQDGYVTTNKPVEGIETYYSDEGKTAATPKVGNSNIYYQDGNKKEYSTEVYNPTVYNGSLVTEYYTKDNQGNYTPSDMMFSYNLYYDPETKEVDDIKSTWNGIEGIAHYYTDNSCNTIATPAFNNQTLWYMDGQEPKQTTVFIDGVTNYYYSNSDGTLSIPTTPSFTSEVWYKNGKITKTVYKTTDHWIPTVSKYYKETYGGSGVYEEIDVMNSNGLINVAYYYVIDDSKPNIVSAQGTEWKASTTYYSDAEGQTVTTDVTFDTDYYVPNYKDTYTTYNETTDAGKDRWKQEEYYRTRTNDDDASVDHYCPVMENIQFPNVKESHDYRGWHQFVLNAYAANTEEDVVPLRSYITDNDWWTICLPYDLTKKEMMLFYGDVSADENGLAQFNKTTVPQLCVLSNVIRDESRRHITLNFSDNLMEKEYTKNDKGIWVPKKNGEEFIVPEDGDVVLHAGVPYLIKPVFQANATRQFDVYGGNNVNKAFSEGRIAVTDTDYPGLADKLAKAQLISGANFRKLMEDNLYTVPALLPADDEGNYTGTEEAYTYSEEPFTIGTKKYVRSKAFDYTFVGSLSKGIIPPFSYFLGWNGKACFVYADYTTDLFAKNKNDKTPDYQNVMYWNNNTCVICPNMLSTASGYSLGKGKHDGKVSLASNDGKEGAQWKIYNLANFTMSPILTDDIYHSSSVSSTLQASPMAMKFGMDMLNNSEGETTSIKVGGVEIMPTVKRIYSLNGQYVGDSLEGLAKGVYIVNGKKVMVK